MEFTAEHEMFRQTVRRFVEQEINPHADEWEEAGIFPAHALFKKMGDPLRGLIDNDGSFLRGRVFEISFSAAR